jgi:hypothetical protein
VRGRTAHRIFFQINGTKCWQKRFMCSTIYFVCFHYISLDSSWDLRFFCRFFCFHFLFVFRRARQCYFCLFVCATSKSKCYFPVELYSLSCYLFKSFQYFVAVCLANIWNKLVCCYFWIWIGLSFRGQLEWLRAVMSSLDDVLVKFWWRLLFLKIGNFLYTWKNCASEWLS